VESWTGSQQVYCTQEDPIGLASGLNLYGFASGDPVTFSDPFGLCPPENIDTWDCGSSFYANRIARGEGNYWANQIAGVINSCAEEERCGTAMAMLLTAGAAGVRDGGVGLTIRRVGPASVNQMNQQIKRGQSPKGLKRVDVGKVKGEQDNLHFDDGSSLNRDGTWKHGGRTLTNAQRQWLEENGWKVPN
jgi:hypothetical protein